MAVVDLRTLSAAKTYTDESLLGGGAIKGANAVIAQIKRGATENEVVFEWTLADGSKQTDSIIVKNGKDGEKGKDGEQGETGVSIVGAHFNSNGKIVFELSDGSETVPISLPSASVDISPDSGNIIEQRGNGIFVPETDTSNFVEKEANKSLISDEDKAQIALNKSAIETLNGDESVVGSVAKQISEALGKLNSLSKEIVDAVPSVADAKDNVIYLLKGERTTYEMYSVVSLPDGSKNMASLGSTEIDLDGYLTVTKAQEIYLALADVDKDTLAKLGTVTEDVVIYLTFNGSKILTLSQIESIVYKKSEVDALLEAKLDKSAVVKSLDSTKTDDEIPSAKCVFDELEGKINSEQGSMNAGKALVINEEGNVVPGDIIDDSTASGNKTWSSNKIKAITNELRKFTLSKTDYQGIEAYPTECGVYRVTKKIDGIPNDASQYATLIIYGNGYFTHIYHDTFGRMWIGYTADSVKAPTWKELVTMGKVVKDSGMAVETLYNNNTGAFLKSDMNLTATRSGILKVSFNKKETGNTFNIYINGVHKYAYPNWWGENVYETAYVPVNNGDNIRISTDVSEGGDWYRIVNVLII